jgi:hypothetical protein
VVTLTTNNWAGLSTGFGPFPFARGGDQKPKPSLQRFLLPYQRIPVAVLVNRLPLGICDAIINGDRLAAKWADG